MTNRTKLNQARRKGATVAAHEHDWACAGTTSAGSKARCTVCGKLSTFERIAHAKHMAAQKRVLALSREHRAQEGQ